MRKQSDLPAVTITVKSDSNIPDSKSNPLSTTFCFLVSPYTQCSKMVQAAE